MAIPFRRTAVTVRAAGLEAAALAGHLLLYPSGLTQEVLPPTPTQAERAPAPTRPDRPPADLLSAPSHSPNCHSPRGGCAHVTAEGHGCTRRSCPRFSATAAAALAADLEPALAPGPVALPETAEADDDHPAHPPVLLLHGLIDNRSVFAVLRRSLRRHGWEHVHAVNYSPLTVDIRSAAAELGRRVEQTRLAYGGDRVAIVGHSLGGLIARYYVQRLGGDEHVHTVVTLGTPHSGTLAARLPSMLPIVRQMRPGSAVLEELRAPSPGCRTRFTAIWGDLDQFVFPRQSARLVHPDLAVRNVLVQGVGHLALPIHCGTMSRIREALATGAPATPTLASEHHPAATDATSRLTA